MNAVVIIIVHSIIIIISPGGPRAQAMAMRTTSRSQSQPKGEGKPGPGSCPSVPFLISLLFVFVCFYFSPFEQDSFRRPPFLNPVDRCGSLCLFSPETEAEELSPPCSSLFCSFSSLLRKFPPELTALTLGPQPTSPPSAQDTP